MFIYLGSCFLAPSNKLRLLHPVPFDWFRKLGRQSLILLLLAFCSAFAQAQQSPMAAPTASVTAAVENATAGSDVVPETVTCYFYRLRLSGGKLEDAINSARKIGMYVDGLKTLEMVNGRWVRLQLEPGHHTIKPKDDQTGLNIDLKRGETYYFRIGWGEHTFFHDTHQRVEIVSREQATYEIEQLKQLEKRHVIAKAGKL